MKPTRQAKCPREEAGGWRRASPALRFMSSNRTRNAGLGSSCPTARRRRAHALAAPGNGCATQKWKPGFPPCSAAGCSVGILPAPSRERDAPVTAGGRAPRYFQPSPRGEGGPRQAFSPAVAGRTYVRRRVITQLDPLDFGPQADEGSGFLNSSPLRGERVAAMRRRVRGHFRRLGPRCLPRTTAGWYIRAHLCDSSMSLTRWLGLALAPALSPKGAI